MLAVRGLDNNEHGKNGHHYLPPNRLLHVSGPNPSTVAGNCQAPPSLSYKRSAIYNFNIAYLSNTIQRAALSLPFFALQRVPEK